MTAPPGTTATVYVPTSTPAAVTEGGCPVAQAAGVRSAFATKFSR